MSIIISISIVIIIFVIRIVSVIFSIPVITILSPHIIIIMPIVIWMIVSIKSIKWIWITINRWNWGLSNWRLDYDIWWLWFGSPPIIESFAAT